MAEKDWIKIGDSYFRFSDIVAVGKTFERNLDVGSYSVTFASRIDTKEIDKPTYHRLEKIILKNLVNESVRPNPEDRPKPEQMTS